MTNGATSYTSFKASYSYVKNVDQNIKGVLSGYKWINTNITYSFPNSFSGDYGSDYPDYSDHKASFSRFSSKQEAAAKSWLDNYTAVSSLKFTELDGPVGSATEDEEATLRFANSDVPGSAFAYYPGKTEYAGDLWYDRNGDDPDLGDLDWRAIGHEIGHALGLSHGHENENSFGSMQEARNSHEFSIMTYHSYVGATGAGYTNDADTGHPQTLMMYDIAGIQLMYGANYSHNATNTTYTVDPNTGRFFVNGVSQGDPNGTIVFRTVWDGGGTDTYSFSNLSTNLNVDLRPGRWVDLDVGGNDMRADLGDEHFSRGHIFNALLHKNDSRSLIENAYGGSGNDTMIGNRADNVLSGNSGNDRMFGHAGNDTIEGGSGNDILVGGDDNDRLYGQDGNDYLYGGIDSDILYGGDDNDRLYGNSGNDRLYGGNGADYLSGGSGNDSMVGGADVPGSDGNDTLYGGYGNDTLRGGDDNDRLYGQDGDDKLYGGIDSDRLYGGNDNDRLYGDSGNDRLYGDSGNDTAVGGSGDDFIYGGSGNDLLSGGTGRDMLYGGTGSDRFRFNSLGESAVGVKRDFIGNFEGAGFSAGDRIDVMSIDARPDLAGNQVFSFVGTNGFFSTGSKSFFGSTGPKSIVAPGTIRVQNEGANTLIQLNTDYDLAPEMEILVDDGAADASDWYAGDFIGVADPSTWAPIDVFLS